MAKKSKRLDKQKPSIEEKPVMIAQWAKQFPKWAIALTIFLGSTAVFAFWWYGKKRRIERDKITSEQPSIAEVGERSEMRPVEIDPDQMLVGERSLYRVTETGVELVRENWLSRKLSAHDQLAYLEREKVLVVGHRDHSVSAYSLSGEQIGLVSPSSGGKFDGYLADNLSDAIYVKDGDMWRGRVDWSTVKIVDEKQITNVGYFLGNPLKGRLMGATSEAMIYRDVRLGLVAVNLRTGKIEPNQLPATCVTSPDGSLIIGDVAGRPAQLGVVDVAALQTQTYPIPYRITQGGLGWVGNTKAVIVFGNREVHLYDHNSQQLNPLYVPINKGAAVRLVAQPSPDGKFVMIEEAGKGVFCVNVDSGEAKLANVPPMNAIEFLNDGYFLSSSDLPDSDQRGTWLGNFTGRDPVRVFAQPLVGKFESQRNQQRSSTPIRTGEIAAIRAFDSWYSINIRMPRIEQFVDENMLHTIEYTWTFD